MRKIRTILRSVAATAIALGAGTVFPGFATGVSLPPGYQPVYQTDFQAGLDRGLMLQGPSERSIQVVAAPFRSCRKTAPKSSTPTGSRTPIRTTTRAI